MKIFIDDFLRFVLISLNSLTVIVYLNQFILLKVDKMLNYIAQSVNFPLKFESFGCGCVCTYTCKYLFIHGF